MSNEAHYTGDVDVDQMIDIMSPKLINTVKKIFGFKNFKKNWDNLGAKKIDEFCIKQAISFLLVIDETNIGTPQTMPTSTGGIRFEWLTEKKDLIIEIDSDSLLIEFFNPLQKLEFAEMYSKQDSSSMNSFLETVKDIMINFSN